jgi:alpha,alpha-trehalose phosphorylase
VGHEDLALEIPPAPQPEPVRQPVGCEPRRRARGVEQPPRHPSTQDSARLR